MHRFLRHEVHPQNPQPRALQYVATLIRAGSIAALPTAAGYALVCALDDKAATDQLRRCADQGERAPATLLCRDLAQAAGYLHVDDHAYRTLRAAADGTQAFVLRSTRRVPRRLSAAAGGASLLQFGGHAAAQGLLDLLDEPLLVVLPPACAITLDQLSDRWLGTLDVALDAGTLLDAQAPQVVDPDGLLQARPSLSHWTGLAPALA